MACWQDTEPLVVRNEPQPPLALHRTPTNPPVPSCDGIRGRTPPDKSDPFAIDLCDLTDCFADQTTPEPMMLI